MNPSQVEEKVWFGVEEGIVSGEEDGGSEVAGQATVGLTSFQPSYCILINSEANRGAKTSNK